MSCCSNGRQPEAHAEVIEVEVIGHRALAVRAPTAPEVRRLCAAAASTRGVRDGHMAVHFVDEARIRELNHSHRDKDAPTDVLAFPIDGVSGTAAQDLQTRADLQAPHDDIPCELGDIFICPPWTADVRAAVVHGVLHLVGMDHETDNGEMLALQARVLAATTGSA
jgi:probable rRNA maturation factor